MMQTIFITGDYLSRVKHSIRIIVECCRTKHCHFPIENESLNLFPLFLCDFDTSTYVIRLMGKTEMT